MAREYFEISAAYEKLCKETISNLCKFCPHNFDKHVGNCMECCPIERSIEDRNKGENNKGEVK